MEAQEDWKITGALRVEPGKGDPFAAAIRATRMPMVITNPRLPDNPIIFANAAFLQSTGYTREEITGRNCRFLQGPLTDRHAVATIREAIAQRRDLNIDILNYRKDGTTFWNALYVSPVHDERGELVYFFASQLDMTERIEARRHVEDEKIRFEREVARRTHDLQIALDEGRRANEELQAALEAQSTLLNEVDHRVKNNLQMISSLIVMQSRNIPDPKIRSSLLSMLERVEALSAVHRRLYQSGDVTRFDLAAFSRDLARDLLHASHRADITLELALEPVEVAPHRAAPIALMINELLTNSLKHAFVDARPGKILLSMQQRDGHATIVVEDDGVGMPADAPGQLPRGGPPDGFEYGKGSFGKSLVEALGRQVRATIRWLPASRGTGTRVEIRWPLPGREVE